jgi:hypothetical protein
VVLRVPHRGGLGDVLLPDGRRVEYRFGDLTDVGLRQPLDASAYAGHY